MTVGPGSTVRILNQPVPAGFKESVRIGEQHLYTRGKELVGDRHPRACEFFVRMAVVSGVEHRTGSGTFTSA